MPRVTMVTDVRSLARSHTRLAIRTLKEICHNRAVQPSARVAAAQILLDRGWGKPEQHIEFTAKIADNMSDAELNAELQRIGQLIDLHANPASPLLEAPEEPIDDDGTVH